LAIVQEFINSEILQKITPHPAAYAFHPGGGIRRCAAMHCGAKWIFHFDLQDFFHHVTEMEVFEIFKNIGYKTLVAFELARICTTTRMPKSLRQLCRPFKQRIVEDDFPYESWGRYGVLPQGAATSPMLSNFAARKLDVALISYARENGFIYTRYADDMVFSAVGLPDNKSVGRIRREIVRLIYDNNFVENKKKFRVAGPGSRKVVLGLLVDGEEPRITRETLKRIDRHLYAAQQYGIAEVSKHEKFESAYGFYNHLSGLIAYVKDVDFQRWKGFDRRLQDLSYSDEMGSS
jgi:RNA-directed DNA polymerase